jgi:hypothetical protein
MDEQTYADFTQAIGEVYCDVVGPLLSDELCAQDGYEVFGKVFGFDSITPEKLHQAQVSRRQLAAIRDSANKYQECKCITEDHVSDILRTILWRWPPQAT